MLYDVPELDEFIEDIKRILDHTGIWVIQLTDLFSMLKLNEFTSFCHEHIFYFTLRYLRTILESHGFSIFDLEYNNTNGGSLRIYTSYFGVYPINRKVINKAIEEENDYFSNNTILDLFDKVDIARDKIKLLFSYLKKRGVDVYGLGASTKGATLCQYFGIDSSDLVAIGEVNSDKFNLVTAGTNIPILPENFVLANDPEYIFLIIWQFKENILKKLKPYIDKGLKVIIPLPYPCVVSSDGEHLL
jgi:NDP-4-keto-2,6-dideoxyhexose 3-C-methyltransferase